MSWIERGVNLGMELQGDCRTKKTILKRYRWGLYLENQEFFFSTSDQ